MVARADILAGRAVIFIDIQDTIEKQLRSIRSKLRMFTAGISEIGGDLFRGGAAGSIASYFPVKEFVNFQDQLLFLQTKLQVTDAQLKPLEKKIRDLGMTTSFSSTEVGKAATMFAQAGFSLQETSDALQASLDLARGGQVDLTTSTTILANAIRTFGADASDAADYASKFIAAARLGTLDLVDLGQSLTYSSGTFAQLGVDIEYVLGLITTLSKSGLKASLAGTSLNTAFLNLSGSADELQEKLGVALTMQDFEEPLVGLTKIQLALDKLSKFDQLKVIQELVNIRGGRAIFGTFLQGLDSLQKVTDQIRNSTDEARLAAIKLDSRLGGVGRRAVSAFQELQLAIGSTAEGPLTVIGERAAAVFNDMSRLAQINPRVTQTLLIMGPAALAAGVGLLTLTTIAGKLAMLLTPLMMLNGVVFQLAGNLAGLVIAQLSAIKNFAMIQGISLVGKKDTKFAENFSKYQSELKDLQTARTTLLAKRDLKVTAAQQKNASRLIQIEQTQAKVRDALNIKMNQRLLKAQETRNQALLSLDKSYNRQKTRLSMELVKVEADALAAQSDLVSRIEGLNKRRVRVEKATQIELKALLSQQAQDRLDLFTKNNTLIQQTQGVELPGFSLDRKLVERSNSIVAKRSRVNKVIATESTKIARELAEQKALLVAANAQEIIELQRQVPITPKSSGPGLISKNDRLQIEAIEAQRKKIIATREKFAKAEADLEARSAKKLADLRSRETSLLARIDREEASVLSKIRNDNEQQLKKREAAIKTRDEQISKQRKLFAKRELALEQQQAKALASLQGKKSRATARIDNAELSALNKLSSVRQALTSSQEKTQSRLNRLDQEFTRRRALLPSPSVDPTAEASLVAKQAAKRKSIIAKAAAEEASILKRARGQLATINKKTKGVKAPIDKSSFMTKDRSFFGGLASLRDGSFFKGIASGFSSIGKMLRGFSIKNLVTQTNWLRVGIKSIFAPLKAIWSLFTGIRRVVFSLSGFLTIVEVLILFGDKIPVVKDILEGLGKAFNNLFKNLGDMFKDIADAFGSIQVGISQIFGGNIEGGIQSLKMGFSDIGTAIKDNLIHTWRTFVHDIKPGIDFLVESFTVAIAAIELAFKGLGAVIGGILGGGGILLKGDGSLLDTLRSMNSQENREAIYAAIGGFIQGLFQALLNAIQEMMRAVLEIQRLVNSISGAIQIAFSYLLEAIASMPQVLTGMTDQQTANLFYKAMEMRNLGGESLEAAEAVGNRSGLALDAVFQAQTDSLNKAFNDFIEAIKRGTAGIQTPLPGESQQDRIRREAQEEFGGLSSLDSRRGRAGMDFNVEDALWGPLTEGLSLTMEEFNIDLAQVHSDLLNKISGIEFKPENAIKDQIDQANAIKSSVAKALVGDFQSTRGSMLQMVPRMEKLQEKANDHLDHIDGNLASLTKKTEPFVYQV